jgi:hypothetical protein
MLADSFPEPSWLEFITDGLQLFAKALPKSNETVLRKNRQRRRCTGTELSVSERSGGHHSRDGSCFLTTPTFMMDIALTNY